MSETIITTEQARKALGNGGSRHALQDEPLEMIAVNKGMAILYAKLARVMGRLNPILPDGMNTYFKYPYQTAGAIANAVRVELAAENVAFLINMVSVDQSQKGKTKAVFHFTFACGDTGATLTRRFEGEAEDGQDKGINKVATAATKYFLIKTFLISPADEVDTDASGSDAPKDRPAKPGNSKPKPASGAKSKPASPAAPKEEAPKDAVNYNLTEIVERVSFMYDHPAHAANSVNAMIDTDEIEPTFSTDAAVWKVFLHCALSKPLNFPKPKVLAALTSAMEAEGSKVPVGSVDQWVKSGKTLEQAWAAVKAFAGMEGTPETVTPF
jgi:hypothetical protein